MNKMTKILAILVAVMLIANQGICLASEPLTAGETYEMAPSGIYEGNNYSGAPDPAPIIESGQVEPTSTSSNNETSAQEATSTETATVISASWDPSDPFDPPPIPTVTPLATPPPPSPSTYPIPDFVGEAIRKAINAAISWLEAQKSALQLQKTDLETQLVTAQNAVVVAENNLRGALLSYRIAQENANDVYNRDMDALSEWRRTEIAALDPSAPDYQDRLQDILVRYEEQHGIIAQNREDTLRPYFQALEAASEASWIAKKRENQLQKQIISIIANINAIDQLIAWLRSCLP